MEALANEVIGKVEVFVAKMQSLSTINSAFLVTLALISGSSKTASMIKSQPLRSLKSVVVFIKFKTFK